MILPKHIGVAWGFLFSIIAAVIALQAPEQYVLIIFLGVWTIGIIAGEILGFSKWIPDSPTKEECHK